MFGQLLSLCFFLWRKGRRKMLGSRVCGSLGCHFGHGSWFPERLWTWNRGTVPFRGFKKMRGAGDSGQSSLYSHERFWKDDQVFEALGTTDELSSQLGVCREKAKNLGLLHIEELITKIQCCLQDLGSHLATPRTSAKEPLKARTQFEAGLVQEVDRMIDSYDSGLPPLRQFILPGGGELSSEFHVARSICRRSERCVASLFRTGSVDPNSLRYLNRLSDLLFVLSRYAAQVTKSPECSYKKPRDFLLSKQWSSKLL